MFITLDVAGGFARAPVNNCAYPNSVKSYLSSYFSLIYSQ